MAQPQFLSQSRQRRGRRRHRGGLQQLGRPGGRGRRAPGRRLSRPSARRRAGLCHRRHLRGSAQGLRRHCHLPRDHRERIHRERRGHGPRRRDPAYFAQAEGLTQTICDAQGTNVDTVSGATFSSAGILNAVNAALEQSNAGGAQ
ncbi:MAG: FMN-binding protein [Collinsella sp.]